MLVASMPVGQALQVASDKCIEVINSPQFGELSNLPDTPRDAQGWFELLSGYDQNPDTDANVGLRRMRAALPVERAAAGARIEHFAVLNALHISANRISSVCLPDTVKHLYATLCIEIAQRERQWEGHFDMEGNPERFLDMAQIATLRRFPAGALNFAYERPAFLRLALNVHPLALPGYLFQRLIAMPFAKPAIGPHVNYARKNSLILLQIDFERAMWLTAKTVEMNPHVTGLNGYSWFYSKITGDVYPNLAWMRDVMVDGGAYLVDTYPAEPGGYGFAYNNRKRQILYDEGKFCPRQTAFFWSRDALLDWASQHPELAPEGETPIQALRRRACIHIKSPKPARHTKRNSSVTLWNGTVALRRFGKLNYITLVLLLPALVSSLACELICGPWLAFLTFPIWVFLAFSFQYFFSL
jgi:hypothetical protein